MKRYRTYEDRDWVAECLADPDVSLIRAAYHEAGHVVGRLAKQQVFRPVRLRNTRDMDWPCYGADTSFGARISGLSGLVAQAVQEWRRDGDAMSVLATVATREQCPRDVTHCREHLSFEDYVVGAGIAAGAGDLQVTDGLNSSEAEELLHETVVLVLTHWAEIELVAVALLDDKPMLSRQQVQEVLNPRKPG